MNGTSPRPILISVPHASLQVPKEVLGNVALSEAEIKGYTDLYTDQVYDMKGYFAVSGKVCRVFVDVNRAPDDIAKEYHMGNDGVVVFTAQDGRNIYKTQPTEELMEQLIAAYHDPYHEELDAVMPKVEFLFDCHSYLPFGPAMKKDAGERRPDFNIGNRRYSTCNRQQTIFLRDFLEERGFSVGINTPYVGGYVLAHHCHRRRIPPFLVPGMQIEISQGLYVDSKTLEPIPGKITEMRCLLQEMFDSFYERFCTLQA